MSFAEWVAQINTWVWGYFMMFVLIGTGIYLTIRLRFIQFRLFRHAWSLISGRWDDPRDHGETTHLQALSTALSATIGTGNIGGVATALVAGGPGAVFWMWVTALVGMCTKGVGAMLSLRFREIDASGVVAGGPMYYLRNGLRAPWLGWVFALCTAVAAFGIGNMVQSNSIADPLSRYFGTAAGFEIGGAGHVAFSKLAIGVALAALVALVTIGGVRRIARVAEKIVPLMAVFYLLSAIAILILNLDAIPGAFAAIFKGAFKMTSVGGGVLGYTIAQAMRNGVEKGLFSSEAGLGSASIAHAAAKTKEPVREGLVSMLGPFIDTITICTVTALVIITSGLLGVSESNGPVLTAEAFEGGIHGVGGHLVAVGLVFFAFSTIIGWSYYGDRSVYYLFGHLGDRAVRTYRWIYVLLIPVGATIELKLVWDIAGIFNGLMAFPNLIALIGLSGLLARMVRDYDRRLPEMRPYKEWTDVWFLNLRRRR